MSEVVTSISQRLDELEAAMQALPEVDCELDHTFTPGLYSRSVYMPSGTLIVSRIHKTKHQFNISAGVCAVKNNDGEWEMIEAPYNGVTEPGTRRVLYIVQNTLWTTYHPVQIEPENDSEEAIKEAVDKVDELILEKHVNEILGGELKNNILIKELVNEN